VEYPPASARGGYPAARTRGGIEEGGDPIPGGLPNLLRRQRHAILLAAVLIAALAGSLRPGEASGATAAPDSVRAMVDGLRLVNYFPADGPHDRMWTNFDAAAIERDLDRVAAMRGNAVRIILDLRVFSVPSPPRVDLDELSRVMAIAARHGLRVELTLFDQLAVCDTCGGYTQIAASERWADAVFAALPHADPRIAFVELQNQIDPHNGDAVRWAQQLLPYVRDASGGRPVTVSVDAPAANLVELQLALGSAIPDFWNLHYYYLPGAALATFEEARRVAAPRPLLVGEVGYSTFPGNTSASGVPPTSSAHEAYQDYLLRSVELATRQAGLPPAAPWLVNDFPCPECAPSDCILDCAPQPCSPCAQLDDFYGILRADGSPKPAAATIAGVFGGLPISTDFNSGFEDPAGTDPADWRIRRPDDATFSRDPTVARTGRASARIQQSAAGLTDSPCWFVEPMTALGDDPYTLGAWVSGRQATGTTEVDIVWIDYQGQEVGTTASSPLPAGDTAWTRLAATATPPAGAVTAQLRLCSSGNAGSAWFDDVSFDRDG
jgi:hypothetical protein